MKDLVTVFKILNVCADRVDDQPLYVEPMCEILRLCSQPFLKEKTSDETAFKQIAVESVSQLGKAVTVTYYDSFMFSLCFLFFSLKKRKRFDFSGLIIIIITNKPYYPNEML